MITAAHHREAKSICVRRRNAGPPSFLHRRRQNKEKHLVPLPRHFKKRNLQMLLFSKVFLVLIVADCCMDTLPPFNDIRPDYAITPSCVIED